MANPIKEKLARGQVVVGTHVSMSDPIICELFGNLGYDFLWIDTEHSTIDYGTLQTHLIAARAGGTPTVVRIPWNDPVLAKRVLEIGPDGILFPFVNSPEEADRAMKSTLYPPLGIRGCGPNRARQYGLEDFDAYVNRIQTDLFRMVQVETETAVKNLRETIKNPYIDLFLVGPFDLSGSIGQLGKVFDKPTDDLINEAIAIVHEAGRHVGVSIGAYTLDEVKYWADKGFDFISCCGDVSYLMRGAQEVLRNLRTATNRDGK